MRKRFILNSFLGIALGASLAFAGYLPLRTDVLEEQPRVDILQHSPDRVQFEVRLPGVELLEGTLEGRIWDRVEIPGGGYEYEIGAPEVPHFTRLLAIPASAGVRAEFEALEVTTLHNIELMPAQGDDPEDLVRNKQPVRFDMSSYSRDAYYPDDEVMTGSPAIMRGLRLVPIRMNPVRYNPVTEDLRIAHRFKVTVYFEGTDLRNVPERPMRPISRSWAKLMRSSVINYDLLDLDIVPVGSYLIVCENDANLVNNILPPLVDWKTRKGHEVAIETFSPGASNNTIKSIIQNAYNNWDIPPEFVLLFGDVDDSYALPGWTTGWWPSDQIDHPYSQLDGGDALADVALGRIPADNVTEAIAMRNKVLWYEMTPYTAHDDWYHQGCVIAGNGSSGISTVQANRWIKTRMIENEFTRVDTFWYWMGGSVASTTNGAINDGISLYNYRGCYEMQNFYVSSIDNLTNGFMMPFVVTITCGTGGFAGSESFMEHFVAVGTSTVPKGAIASVGTATLNTHTRQNNTIDMGIFAGIFEDGLTEAGNALNRGKLELYNAFITHDPYSVADFSEYAALAGDPGVDIFNAAIRYMSCDIPPSMTYGENALALTINEIGGGPLEDALVCYYKVGEIHEVGLTDANGQITLPVNTLSPGNMKITITKNNFYPIVDSLDIIQEAVAVGYFDHSIDDDENGSSSGDDDGFINPTETVEIPLVFKNYGTSTTATSVSVTATESDDYVTLSDNYETFPNLAPGATANSYDDFDLTVASDCPDGHAIHLDLITNSSQGSWVGTLDLQVVSYDISIREATTSGGDTLLAAGQTTDFFLTISNNGGKDATALTATITSLDPYITVNDNSASFGTVNVGSIVTCSSDPFNLAAAVNVAPGHQAKLIVDFTSSTGATQRDTIAVSIGAKSTADPQGPDEYGYYCFDNTDLNYAQAPTYNWIEIDPNHGGSGVQLSIYDSGENQDASVNVQLPFTFRYYGQDVDDITVCSNGWIAMNADNSYTDFRNYPIPSCIGPDGMVAAFWDDLITWSSGYIYAYHDASNHRLIIEWSRVKNYNGWSTAPVEVFEIVLFDPDYYPTITGDGEILFQYHTIVEVSGPGDDIPYSTVGIENWDQSDGIEVVYWNTYDDPAAAHLANGRAYLFTTNFDYSPPGSNLYITLTPYGTPIVIPGTGGSFDYNIEVGNSSSSSASADIWCDVTLPNGTIYGPTLGPVTGVSFLPTWSINRDRTQVVPAGAPGGSYTYHAYIGVYPSIVYDEDTFNFTKSADGPETNWTIGWENYGEPFEDTWGQALDVIPDEFALHPAYPNPFNPTATLTFDLPVDSRVKLEVFNLLGQSVSAIVNGPMPAGKHAVIWDASFAPSGIYLLRMQASDFTASQKLILVK